MRRYVAFAVIAGFIAMTAAARASETSPPSRASGPDIVIAQAGSTGGTIGKQNKSISGGDETAKPIPSMPSKDPNRVRKPDVQRDQSSKAGQGISMSGRWLWESVCGTSQGAGAFDINHGPEGELTGQFTGSIHIGSLNGRLVENRVSFTRNYGLTQQWTGVVTQAAANRLQMTGTFTDPFVSGCRFKASKG